MRNQPHPNVSTRHDHGAHERPVGWFKRSVILLLLASIINGMCLPLVHAQIAKRRQQAAQQQWQSGGAAQRYASALERLHDALSTSSGASTPAIAAQLPAPQTLQQPAAELAEEWRELRDTWEAADGVDRRIIERQLAQEKAFAARHGELLARLAAVQANGSGDAALQALKDFLQAEKPRRTHLPVDPNNLPWQVEAPRQQQTATVRIERESRSAGPATSAVAQSAPTNADLAETVDARHTDAIKELAQRLGRDPHKIYQWVHDNIHYVPTQGSVQGAQDTLDKKAGNAIDSASLLVALLRSSGIPARYVTGTVEIPIAQAMNWVGGAKTAAAAQQILGQGGVPNTIITMGGKDFAMRIQHAWVESHIQYQPGRGARHIAGQSAPDTWVPMDASYKQYRFTEGMDLQTAVPLDVNALLTAASQGAEINEAEGWVRGINKAALEQQLKAYQEQLAAHINNQNGGKSTTGDVLGTRIAKIDPLPYLAGTLPYTIKTREQQFSEVPDAMRASFRYRIFADERSASWGDSPLLEWQAPTASIAGKKVTIAWVAATAADAAAVAALIPKPAAGQQLDPSQLPRGLSSSIALKPEIRLEGQTVATGPAMSAGSEPVGAGAFTRYGSQDWDETRDQLIAGQQTALGLSVQGVSPAQLDALKERMEQTQVKLQQVQAVPEFQRAAILRDMKGENLTGDLLTATIWGYFASLQSHGIVAAAQAQMYDAPALSYGLFHAQVRPNKLYGIVTTGVSFAGLNMDIGHLRSRRWVLDDAPQSPVNAKPELAANGKSAAQNRWIAYNKMRGQNASAMEHAVPEESWIDKKECRYTDSNSNIQNPTLTSCAQGISAIKAIAIAQADGQRIYTITPQNAATALPNLPIGGSVGVEIRSAIQAGKQVTVHERAISAHGWMGYGYIVTDPETGAGAYIIEGGGNGGFLDFWENNGTSIGIVLFMLSLIALAYPPATILLVLFRCFLLFSTFMNILVIKLKVKDNGCPNGMSALGVSLEVAAFVIGFGGVVGFGIGSVLSFIINGAFDIATPACRRA